MVQLPVPFLRPTEVPKASSSTPFLKLLAVPPGYQFKDSIQLTSHELSQRRISSSIVSTGSVEASRFA